MNVLSKTSLRKYFSLDDHTSHTRCFLHKVIPNIYFAKTLNLSICIFFKSLKFLFSFHKQERLSEKEKILIQERRCFLEGKPTEVMQLIEPATLPFLASHGPMATNETSFLLFSQILSFSDKHKIYTKRKIVFTLLLTGMLCYVIFS